MLTTTLRGPAPVIVVLVVVTVIGDQVSASGGSTLTSKLATSKLPTYMASHSEALSQAGSQACSQ